MPKTAKKKEYSNSTPMLVRLTLDKIADADVIEIMNTVPFGSKGKMIVQAIRVACRIVGDEVQVMPSSIPQMDKLPVQATPAQEIQAKKPVVVEVDSF